MMKLRMKKMDSWEGDQEYTLYIGLLVKVIQYDLGLSFQILDFIGLPGICVCFSRKLYMRK